MFRLSEAAESVLPRLQVLSCDISLLFLNAEKLSRARRLQHLFIRWGGVLAVGGRQLLPS